MKHIFLAIFLLSIPLASFAQKQSIKKFYRQYKKGKDTRNFIVPGFLIRLGTGLARDMVETDEQYEMLKLARSIRNARILFSEDYNPVKKKDIQELVKGVRNIAYDDMIKVKSDGTDVQIMVKEDGKKIKGLLILVSEEDTFMMLHLKTKLKYEDINQLLKLLQDKLPIKEEEEEKPRPPIV